MQIALSIILLSMSVVADAYGIYCLCERIIALKRQNKRRQTVSGTDDLSDKDDK